MDAKIKTILEGISTATLTTVLLKKGLRNVGLRGAFPKQPGQARAVGTAVTLRFGPAPVNRFAYEQNTPRFIWIFRNERAPAGPRALPWVQLQRSL